MVTFQRCNDVTIQRDYGRERHTRRQRNLFEHSGRKHFRRVAMRFCAADRVQSALFLLRHRLRVRRGKEAVPRRGARPGPTAGGPLPNPKSEIRNPKCISASSRRLLPIATRRTDRRRAAAATQFVATDESALRRRFHGAARDQRRARHCGSGPARAPRHGLEMSEQR